jgi:hypothetical protein
VGGGAARAGPHHLLKHARMHDVPALAVDHEPAAGPRLGRGRGGGVGAHQLASGDDMRVPAITGARPARASAVHRSSTSQRAKASCSLPSRKVQSSCTLSDLRGPRRRQRGPGLPRPAGNRLSAAPQAALDRSSRCEQRLIGSKACRLVSAGVISG